MHAAWRKRAEEAESALAEARREERERLLDMAAGCEAEIISEPKHLASEKAGAHMLGALIRKRAGAP